MKNAPAIGGALFFDRKKSLITQMRDQIASFSSLAGRKATFFDALI